DNVAAHGCLLARPPRLIRRLGLLADGQRMARRALRLGGAGELGHRLLLPRLARRATGRRRRIGGVMQPAVPVGRNARGFGDTVVHHPALAAATGDDALVLEVAIAFGVGADELAAHLREEPGADYH